MSNVNIVAIFAKGTAPTEKILQKKLNDVNLVIAADGGAEICRRFCIEPQYIVGDLDSITMTTREYFKKTKIVNIHDQDTTDLEKAINFANRFNPNSIRIFGSSGNRSDHMINNLLTFWNYTYSFKLEIIDDLGEVKILEPGRHCIMGKAGDTVSLFSFSAIQNLQLVNFRYLPSETDFKDNFCSISNVLTAENGIISFASGKLLIYQLF